MVAGHEVMDAEPPTVLVWRGARDSFCPGPPCGVVANFRSAPGVTPGRRCDPSTRGLGAISDDGIRGAGAAPVARLPDREQLDVEDERAARRARLGRLVAVRERAGNPEPD